MSELFLQNSESHALYTNTKSHPSQKVSRNHVIPVKLHGRGSMIMQFRKLVESEVERERILGDLKPTQSVPNDR